MSVEQCDVCFDRAAFSVESVKKAVYRLAGRLDAEIRLTETDIVCLIRARIPADSVGLEQLVAQFRREVLDQDLRASIRRETEGVRNLILAFAFSNTGLIQNE